MPAWPAEQSTALRAVGRLGPVHRLELVTSLVLLAALLVGVSAVASAAGPLRFVSDTFSRQSPLGWRTADEGGHYKYASGVDGFAVGDGVGSLVLAAPGILRTAQLTGVAARDVNLRFRFSLDKIAGRAGATVEALIRQNASGDGYRADVHIRADRTVWLSVIRVADGVVTPVSRERQVSSTTMSPTGWLWLRVKAVGAAPTRLQVKVWASGRAQPGAWQVDLTDSNDVTAAGSIGVGGRLATTATDAPIRFRFDDLSATADTTPAAESRSDTGYAPNTTLRYVPTPRLPLPGYLAPIIDPTWSTQVTRISNLPGTRNTYSRRQAWNSDGSLVLLGMGGTGPRMLLDGRTYALLNPAVGGDGIWSETNASYLIRASTATGNVFNYDPMRNTIAGTITNLSTYNTGSTLKTMAQSSVDDAGRYLLLYGVTSTGQKTVIVLDMLNLTTSTLNVSTEPHAGSISHSGRYVALNWDAAGSGREQGIWLYDIGLHVVRQIANSKAHGDFAYDTSGNEVLVSVPPGQGTVVMQRLSDGVQTVVLAAGTAMIRGHISGRNSDRPGWVYCSIYDSNNTSTRPGADQVFALKLDGSQTVEVFAFAHHGVDVYSADPMASVSRDGERVIFGSEWDAKNVYAYVAEQAP